MRMRRPHTSSFSYRTILRGGLTAISVACAQFAHGTPYRPGGPTADPFQADARRPTFKTVTPDDFGHESPLAKATPEVTAPPLDLFGSTSDLKNAATAASNTPEDAATLSSGVLTVRLTQSGLNVVNIRIPDGTAISGIDVLTGSGVVPAGLVLNVAGNRIVLSASRFNLGLLDNRQVLFSFGGEAFLLSALSPKLATLAPLAAARFDKGGVNSALVLAGKPGLSDAAFGAPLHGSGANGGGTSAADRGR